MSGEPPPVTMFTTGPDCTLCEATKADLERLRERFAFRLEIVDLRTRPESVLNYALRAPVVLLAGRVLAEGRIAPGTLERALQEAGIAPRPAGGGDPG